MIRMLCSAALMMGSSAFAQDVLGADDDFGLGFEEHGWEEVELSGQIVEGKEEDGFPSAVSIGLQFGGRPQSTCSASLITPRILLTAAHCSAEFGVPVDVIAEFGVAFFGPNVREVGENRIIGYDDIIIHPRYEGLAGGGTPEFDMSVIILEKDAPVDPVPFNMEELKRKDVLGLKVTSVGYGITDGATQSGSGIKRSAKLTISDFDDQFIISNSQDNDGSNVCSGDSGGPQYYKTDDGRWVQWSVHSWADQFCNFTSGSTRTDIVSGWIMRQVENVHGTDNYCEAAGFLSNGTCDDWCGFDPECFDDTKLGRKEACEADPDCESVGACSQGGGAPSWAFLVGLMAMGARRRPVAG